MTPDTYTIAEHHFSVGDGHTLYVHDWGNPDAEKAIVSLHGGPGGGSKDSHKGRFDPTRQRVIFFDQRGCGHSTPRGSLTNNTTEKLVEDISTIADKLKLDTFILTGGSWGSCLALAYALKHPERVSAMVLNGVFTGSEAEIDWLNNGLFRTTFPDAWERYLAATPAEHHKDPTAYHYGRIVSGGEAAARASGYAYTMLMGSIMALDDRFTPSDPAEFDPTDMRMEMHYLANRCFMPNRYILNHASKLTMPIWLVQGRYDMVCPPFTAYELHKQLPNSELAWTINGHRGDHESVTVSKTILLQLTNG
ncbi:alpha/beta fold hydrolase [Candidatus Saccharibacteria bacterium]|nr:MAG: alpha/beta fold hydrolase [Candidatus Saccharibacteria bacterium]